MINWENGKLEEYGIPAQEARRFEEQIAASGVQLHGYLFLQGKKILAEKYYSVYNKESLHRMYSVTKSFVSMAVGLLIKEGKIALQDKICDYFPEYVENSEIHSWCKKMTIEDLLTMRTCYSSTTFKRYASDDWTESFFRVEPDHVPGTVFSYDTSASHTLTALVERLSGKKLLDFLREGCLNECGFSKEAYILSDPVGVSQGGSGMMCTLRDMACAAYLCNHFGILDGKELLPEDYMRRATTNLVPTDLQPVQDEKCGYGYFFWMPREEGFCMYGMGGQLALCFPKKDFCLLTMADTIGNPSGLQVLYDCFYHFIYPYLQDRQPDNPLAFDEGKRQNQGKPAPSITKSRKYVFYPNAMNLTDLEIDWSVSRKICLCCDGIKYSWTYRPNVWIESKFPKSAMRCRNHVEEKQGHLILQSYLVDEEQGHLFIDIAFREKELGLRMDSTNEPFFDGMNGFASAKLV